MLSNGYEWFLLAFGWFLSTSYLRMVYFRLSDGYFKGLLSDDFLRRLTFGWLLWSSLVIVECFSMLRSPVFDKVLLKADFLKRTFWSNYVACVAAVPVQSFPFNGLFRGTFWAQRLTSFSVKQLGFGQLPRHLPIGSATITWNDFSEMISMKSFLWFQCVRIASD